MGKFLWWVSSIIPLPTAGVLYFQSFQLMRNAKFYVQYSFLYYLLATLAAIYNAMFYANYCCVNGVFGG